MKTVKMTKKMQAILDEYNRAIKSFEEYDRSEDSYLADYCREYALQETSPIDLVSDASLDEDVSESLLKLSSRTLRQTLESYTKLELVDSYYRIENELHTLHLQEREHQPDDDLIERFLALKTEQRELIAEKANAHISSSGWIYIDHGPTRWVLVFDADRYLESHPPKPKLSVIQGNNPFCSRPSRARLEVVA